MRRFELHREEDESGVSGTGLVAQAVEFDCGKVALTWISNFGTVAVYDNLLVVKKLHGHEGKTRVVFLDKDDHEEDQSIADPKPESDPESKKKPIKKNGKG